MNGLLARSLAVALASLLAFMAAAGLALVLALPGILAGWERAGQLRLDQACEQRLAALAADPDRSAWSAAELSRRVREALQNLPARPEYLVVLDAAGETVYLNHLGDNPPGPGTNLIRSLKAQASWRSLEAGGRPWLSFSAKVLPFDTDESNRLLFSALGVAVLWSVLAAVLVAALTAYLLSRPLSRQARALVDSLSALRAGQRDLSLPVRGVKELGEIARSTLALQASLRREEAIRRQWAADIAHDLRTPLSVLKGQFEGMIDGVLAPDRPRLERNHQELLRLERLVAQLAELTRLESPEMTLSLQELDAAELMRGLAARSAERAALLGTELELELPQAELGLRADPALLDRALQNLIDNAFQHGLPGTPLRLACSGGARELSLSVESGGAIDPSHLDQLFDRLYRADPARGSSGSGLGLAIVKAIALAHGGRVGVQSDQAAGRTRFELVLPRNFTPSSPG